MDLNSTKYFNTFPTRGKFFSGLSVCISFYWSTSRYISIVSWTFSSFFFLYKNFLECSFSISSLDTSLVCFSGRCGGIFSWENIYVSKIFKCIRVTQTMLKCLSLHYRPLRFNTILFFCFGGRILFLPHDSFIGLLQEQAFRFIHQFCYFCFLIFHLQFYLYSFLLFLFGCGLLRVFYFLVYSSSVHLKIFFLLNNKSTETINFPVSIYTREDCYYFLLKKSSFNIWYLQFLCIFMPITQMKAS